MENEAGLEVYAFHLSSWKVELGRLLQKVSLGCGVRLSETKHKVSGISLVV